MNGKGLALACVLVLCAPAWVGAQPTPKGRGRDRARTFLVVRLAEELNLPDDKALQVSRIIRETDERRLALVEKRQAVETKLRAALEGPTPDTAALGTLIAEANQIDEEIALVPEHTMREAQKVLTPEQQARLVLFRPELNRQIRRALTRRAGAGAGPAGERRRRPWRRAE